MSWRDWLNSSCFAAQKLVWVPCLRIIVSRKLYVNLWHSHLVFNFQKIRNKKLLAEAVKGSNWEKFSTERQSNLPKKKNDEVLFVVRECKQANKCLRKLYAKEYAGESSFLGVPPSFPISCSLKLFLLQKKSAGE